MVTSLRHIWRFPRRDDLQTTQDYVEYPEIVDTTLGPMLVFCLRKNLGEGEDGGVYFARYVDESPTSTKIDRDVVIEVVAPDDEMQVKKDLKAQGYPDLFQSALRIPESKGPRHPLPTPEVMNQTEISDRIIDLLERYRQQGKYWLTPREVANELGSNINAVHAGIRKLIRERQIRTKQFTGDGLSLGLGDYAGPADYQHLLRSNDG